MKRETRETFSYTSLKILVYSSVFKIIFLMIVNILTKIINDAWLTDDEKGSSIFY